MAQIGYVGLGVMGGGVARRLLEAGHEVTGHNRTRSKAEPLIADGMAVRRDAARGGRAERRRLLDGHQHAGARRPSRDGPDGILAGLGPGKVYVDMSTVSPAASRALAERVAETGAVMLDAPVSGSVITLEQGKLSVIVGGDEADVRARAADPARHRADGHARRRQRSGGADEDRHQPQPRRADARVQRGRAAGREGRDLARGRRARC